MMGIKNRIISLFAKGFVLGLVGLSGFYYLLLYAVTLDPMHPLDQFLLLQPWMSLLIVGFGIQMGLYWLLRNGVHIDIQKNGDASVAAGTSSAVSGMAMIACCAHHVVDVLPILGFSAAAVFLSEYQKEFLVLGVAANVLGMGMMASFLTSKEKISEIFRSIK